MHRGIPVISKIVNRKLVQEQQDAHLSRLSNMKATMQTLQPQVEYRHLETRPKKK